MRLPGHGGMCLPGHIQPVSTTPNPGTLLEFVQPVSTTPNPGIPTSQFLTTEPGTLLEFVGTFGAMYGKRRFWYWFRRIVRNRETIRFAMLAMLVIAQIWIDVVCIMLWRLSCRPLSST